MCRIELQKFPFKLIPIASPRHYGLTESRGSHSSLLFSVTIEQATGYNPLFCQTTSVIMCEVKQQPVEIFCVPFLVRGCVLCIFSNSTKERWIEGQPSPVHNRR